MSGALRNASSRLALLALTLALGDGAQAGAADPDLPSIQARKIFRGPQIDGDLSDAVWKVAAKALKSFQTFDGARAEIQTDVYLLYDNENLYLAFNCYEPNMAGLRAQATDRNGFWRKGQENDVATVFLQTDDDIRTIFQLGINPAGAKFDVQRSAGKKEYGFGDRCEAAAKKGTDSWTVEVKLPFKALKIGPRMGTTWRTNFTRYRAQTHDPTTWAPVGGDWRDHKKYGSLEGVIIELPVDSKPHFAVLAAEVAKPKLGVVNQLRLKVASRTKKRDVKVTTALTEPDGKVSTSTTLVPFKRREKKDLYLPYKLPTGSTGKYSVSVSFLDPQSNEILYQTPPAILTLSRSLVTYLDRFYYTREKTARVIVEPEAANGELGELAVQGELREQAGKRIAVGRPRTRKRPPAQVLEFDIAKLVPGDYSVAVSLNDGQGNRVKEEELKLRKRAPTRREVKVDRERMCLLVDGKPSFCIRLYTGRDPVSYIASEGMRELRDAGLDSIGPMGYAFFGGAGDGWGKLNTTNSIESVIELMRDKLDIYHAAGFTVVLDIGNSIPRRHISPLPEKQEIRAGKLPNHPSLTKVLDDSRKIFTALKDHPAILLWYGLDEMNIGWARESKRLNALRWEIDPYHPLYVIGVGGGVPGTCQLFGVNPGMHDYGAKGQTLIFVDSYTDTQHTVARRNRQNLSMIVQFTAAHYQRDTMSPAETRLATYLEIIHGSKSMGYWVNYQYQLNGSKPMWDTYKSLFREMKQLERVLVEISPRQKVNSNDQAMHLLLKEHQGKLYLLTANKSKTEITSTFDIPALRGNSKVEVLFEKRKIKAAGTTFTDTFDGYGTHVYRLQPAATPARHLITVTAERGEREVDIEAVYRKREAWYNSTGNMIAVMGEGNTLQSIATDLANPAVFSYDAKTRTAVCDANLTINYKASLTIGRQDDPSFKEVLRMVNKDCEIMATCGTLLIYNSTLIGKDRNGSIMARKVPARVAAWNSEISGFFTFNRNKGGLAELYDCYIHDNQYVAMNFTTVRGCRLENNMALYDTEPHTYTDCAISGTPLLANSYTTLVNTSYDLLDDYLQQKRSISNGYLTVKWHLNVEVVDAVGKPIAGRAVLLEAKDGVDDVKGITDAEGQCRLAPVQVVIRKDGVTRGRYDIKIATGADAYETVRRDWTPTASEKLRHIVGKGL